MAGFDYKIGVKLAMTSNIPEIAAVLIRQLGGIDAKAKDLQGRFTKLKAAILGAFSIGAGLAIFDTMNKLMEKTADLSHAFVQMQKLGNQSNSDLQKAMDNAIRITQDVRGINQRQALDIYSQTYSFLGKKDALAVQEALAKFDVLTANTSGNWSDHGGAGSRALARAAEQMGRLTNPDTKEVDLPRFLHFMDLAARINNLTHGQVGAQQWYQIAQQGGPALMNMGDRALGEIAILSQYMGAGRTGTATMSAMQQFAGGTMYSRNAAALQQIGILGAQGKLDKKTGQIIGGEWATGGGGGRVILTQEARDRLSKMFSDPLNAVISKLVPAMIAHGLTTPEQQVDEIFNLFMRQTTQREFADLLRNRGQMLRELGRIDKGAGLDESLKLANTGDIEQNLHNLQTAWQNLLYAVGGPDSENYIAVLQKLTAVIREATDFARAHPDAMKEIAVGVAALGAAFIGVGAAALLAALGTGGWLIAGIGALGAVAADIYIHWNTFLQVMKDSLDPIKVMSDDFSQLYKALNVHWAGGFAALIAGLKTLWDKLKGFLGSHMLQPGEDQGLTPGLYTGGAYLSNTAYYTGSGDGTVPSGIANSAAAAPMAGAMPGYSHNANMRVPYTTNAAAMGQIPAAATSNAWIAAQRQRFASQLQDPNTRLQVMAMMNTEGMPVQDLESLLNRATFAHKSILQMLHSGFYGPFNSGLAQGRMRGIAHNKRLIDEYNRAIATVMAGSDVIRGHTDQGNLGLGDKGAAWEWAHSNVHYPNKEVFGDWLQGHGTSGWREDFEAHAHASAAIPPTTSGDTHIHIDNHLDGHKVSKHIAKHLADSVKGPPTGAREPDRWTTYPASDPFTTTI